MTLRCLCAEDPLWWSKEELELLRGTRPGATVAIYDRGIQSLRDWRARLCSIQRCACRRVQLGTVHGCLCCWLGTHESSPISRLLLPEAGNSVARTRLERAHGQ